MPMRVGMAPTTVPLAAKDVPRPRQDRKTRRRHVRLARHPDAPPMRVTPGFMRHKACGARKEA